MATAKPQGKSRARAALRRRLVLALVLVAGGAALAWPWFQPRALLATAYGARIGCTCHFIAHRRLDDCRKDFEPGMRLVMLSADPAERRVTATIPLLARQSAQLRDGFGCLLQPWPQ